MLLVCTLLIVSIQSQNYVDILKFSGSTTPPNTFDSSASKTALTEYSADISLPIKLGTKTVLLTGATYENFQTKLFASGNVKNVGSVAVKLGLVYNLNSRLSLTALALPKYAGNYGATTNINFQMGGITIFKFSKSKNFNFRYGLYYNSERFGPFFVPLLGCYYLSKNSRFELNAMLPIAADVNYKLLNWLHAGINFNGQTKSYGLNKIKGGLPASYVSRVTNEIFGYLRFNATQKIIFQTKVGYSLGRKYKVFNDGDKTDLAFPLTYIGDNRRQLNTNFSDGLIFQMVFIYRVNL